MPSALEYAQQLVTFDSVSRASNVPVTDYVAEVMSSLGCEIERLEYDDANGVRKACVIGRLGPAVVHADREHHGMAYFGHTDVVPADVWFTDQRGPFEPTVKDGRLYGRGSCDMKGSIACMLAATELVDAKSLTAPLFITCTADEEVGYHGARLVAQKSEFFAQMVQDQSYGVIGEPTLLEVVHAHKGTFGIKAISHGEAAHSSTSQGLNANLAMIPFLSELKAVHDEVEQNPDWQDSRFDPPTQTWNIIMSDHTRAVNVKPARTVVQVYFRPMPGQDVEPLIQRCRRKARECGLEFSLEMRGQPLIVDPQSAIVRETLELADRYEPQTVSYGTDGAMLGALENLVVIGPGSIAQAHTHDEWVALEQLESGTDLYRRMIERWCIR